MARVQQDEAGTLDCFWPHLLHTLHECDRHYITSNESVAEKLLVRVEDCEFVVRALLGCALEGSNQSWLLGNIHSKGPLCTIMWQGKSTSAAPGPSHLQLPPVQRRMDTPPAPLPTPVLWQTCFIEHGEPAFLSQLIWAWWACSFEHGEPAFLSMMSLLIWAWWVCFNSWA